MRRYGIRRPNDDVEIVPPAPAAERSAPKSDLVPSNDLRDAAINPPDSTRMDSAAKDDPKTSQPPAITSNRSSVSDTEMPPLNPLSAQERAKRTVANLKRIGAALENHFEEKGYYPSRGIPRNLPDGNLSWRVELLPYLGYGELYAQFHFDEPWNSRHNSTLLPSIPAVYQSPERFDERTNYVLPVASGTIFSRNRASRPSYFEDGLENTVMVVEVDDQWSVPWTAPRELDLVLSDPAARLGTLREGSFFVVWGGGQVGRVLTSAGQGNLKAMFTYDAGENFHAGKVDQPLLAPTPVVSQVAVQESGGQRGAPAAAGGVAAPDSALASLAAGYFARASELLAAGQERDATRCYYAGVVLSPPGGDWRQHYGWVPAIRRPTPVLRIGIGLAYSGSREKDFNLVHATSSGRSRRASDPWSAVTGEFGEKLVETLERHLSTHGDQSFLANQEADTAKSRRKRQPRSLLADERAVLLAPGVSFLTVGRESLVRSVAEIEEVDLLVMVDWRESSRDWSVGLKLVDVARDKTLFTIPRLASAEIDKARSHPLAPNPLTAALLELTEFLERQCTFSELPSQLQPRHAKQRCEQLAIAEETNPMRSLAEMRFYHELGMVDAPQLLKALQVKIGKDAGIELILGTADAKQQSLAPWLPSPSLLTDAPTVSRSSRGRNRDN
jgi:hypothetical protein